MKDNENRDPLVSDDVLIGKLPMPNEAEEYQFYPSARSVRDLYEAARSKDKERIAALEAAGKDMATAITSIYEPSRLEFADRHQLETAVAAWERTSAAALSTQQPTPER